ncbi:site-2 protease family protein [Planctomycetota bacterium]
MIWIPILLIILFFSAIVHECAHGLAAYKLGDPTAYYAGRITLNPLVHIDPMMTLILPLVLFLTTGFVFGGAKPVPINPYNFRNPEKGMMLSSLAGPVSNLILALLGFALFFPLARISTGTFLQFNYYIFVWFIYINILLALFNIIPIPPLDGSRILRYFLPWDMKESLDRIEPFGLIIIFILFYMGGFRFLSMLMDYVELILSRMVGG